MTEAEAESKWCPFARPDMTHITPNRDYDGRPTQGAYCIASHCMAWVMPDPDRSDGFCGLVRG